MLEFREVGGAELAGAALLLARGSRDAPMHRAVFGPDAEHRQRRLGLYFGALLPQMECPPLGAWDGGRLLGVLGRCPPGACLAQLCRPLPVEAGGAEEVGALWAWAAAAWEHDLPEPHWHVGPVAVDAGRQGQGVGGRLLRAFCADLDGRGEAAFLEADSPAAVRFYARHGFRVTDEGEVLGTATWWMRRPPGAGPPRA